MKRAVLFLSFCAILFFFHTACLKAERNSRDVSTSSGLINDILYLLTIANSIESVSSLSPPFLINGESYFSIMRGLGSETSVYIVQTKDGVTFTGYPVNGMKYARSVGGTGTVGYMAGAIFDPSFITFYFSQFDQLNSSGSNIANGRLSNYITPVGVTSLSSSTTPSLSPSPTNPTLPSGEFVYRIFPFLAGGSSRYFLTATSTMQPYRLFFSPDFVSNSPVLLGSQTFRDANACNTVYFGGGTVACGVFSGASQISPLTPGSAPAGTFINELMLNESVPGNFVWPIQTSGAPNFTLDFRFGTTFPPGNIFAGTRPFSLGFSNPRRFKMVGTGGAGFAAIVFLADFCDSSGCGTHVVFINATGETSTSGQPMASAPFGDGDSERGMALFTTTGGNKVHFLYMQKEFLGSRQLMKITYDGLTVTPAQPVPITYLP
ncbi:hypothetical protein CH373_03450 [Leptospira perolatii]|nr:hypothetical protein [Leptospira perolatii]PJZ75084.1 hypothetical protein CH373_03450 [Leptospira perolatii]